MPKMPAPVLSKPAPPDLPAGPQTISCYYRAPFRYDGISYIWDANHEMVADMRGDRDCIRPRGWGRFQYMLDGAKIHDAMEKLIVGACQAAADSPEHCVERLNQLWEENPILVLDSDLST